MAWAGIGVLAVSAIAALSVAYVLVSTPFTADPYGVDCGSVRQRTVRPLYADPGNGENILVGSRNALSEIGLTLADSERAARYLSLVFADLGADAEPPPALQTVERQAADNRVALRDAEVRLLAEEKAGAARCGDAEASLRRWAAGAAIGAIMLLALALRDLVRFRAVVAGASVRRRGPSRYGLSAAPLVVLLLWTSLLPLVVARPWPVMVQSSVLVTGFVALTERRKRYAAVLGSCIATLALQELILRANVLSGERVLGWKDLLVELGFIHASPTAAEVRPLIAVTVSLSLACSAALVITILSTTARRRGCLDIGASVRTRVALRLRSSERASASLAASGLFVASIAGIVAAQVQGGPAAPRGDGRIGAVVRPPALDGTEAADYVALTKSTVAIEVGSGSSVSFRVSICLSGEPEGPIAAALDGNGLPQPRFADLGIVLADDARLGSIERGRGVSLIESGRAQLLFVSLNQVDLCASGGPASELIFSGRTITPLVAEHNGISNLVLPTIEPHSTGSASARLFEDIGGGWASAGMVVAEVERSLTPDEQLEVQRPEGDPTASLSWSEEAPLRAQARWANLPRQARARYIGSIANVFLGVGASLAAVGAQQLIAIRRRRRADEVTGGPAVP